MAWVLRHKNGKLELSDTLKVGRKLFPNDRKMSQEHAELIVEEDQLFLRDLNSANGSFLQGRKLPPNEIVPVLHGDLLMLGETKFAVDEDHEHEQDLNDSEGSSQEMAWVGCALLVFAGLILFLLSPPSMAHGQSLGPKLLSVVLGLAFVSVALVALPLSALFLRVGLTLQSALAFLALLALGSLGAYSVLSGAVDEQFPLSQAMIAAKVEYFCHKKFNKPMCVQSLVSCPSCMNSVRNYLNTYGEEPLPKLPTPSEINPASH